MVDALNPNVSETPDLFSIELGKEADSPWWIIPFRLAKDTKWGSSRCRWLWAGWVSSDGYRSSWSRM